jgi:PKD domain
MTKLLKAFASLAIWFIPVVFVACGGDNPAPNKPPVSSFTAASSVKAGDALLFTSSSSDPDGDVLTQSWDFGDDTRGGGSSIAHVFPSAGLFTVKLTVGDGKGGENSTTQSITVTAGEPLGAPLEVSGDITDTSGLPLAGVAVKLGDTVLGTSDANGKVMVSIPTGPSQTLMLFKEGYTDQVAALEFPIGSSSGNAFFKLSMLTQAPSQPMSATTGGAITGEDNAKLEIPANGLETENGTPVTGNVQVSITPLDVSDPAVLAAMPGRLEGVQTDGSSAGIVSLGMTDFSLRQNGQDLNLKPGSSAKVRIPLYADTDESGKLLVLGDTIPLWSLSETTGEWVQEGIGTVVDAGNGIKALEATVTHFSLWNGDKVYDENRVKPKPNPPLPPLPNVKPKCKIPPEIEAEFDAQTNAAAKKAVFCLYLVEAIDVFSDENMILDGASRLRTQATTPRLPAWRASGNLSFAGTETATGNETMNVPPNRKIRHTACLVLIGKEFCGSETKKLQRGTTTEFTIFMLPVQKETVTVPLDITRSFANSRRELSFELAVANELTFRLERINGSVLDAQVELIRDGFRVFSSELGQAAVNATYSLSKSKYTLVVTPSGGLSGDVRVRISTRPNTGATWTPFYQVSDTDILYSQKPCFASAGNATGHTLMAWTERKASTYSLRVSQYDPTADSFDAATTLATNNSSTYRCQIAVSSNGDAMIIWWLRAGTNTKNLFWARRAVGSSAWSSPTLLATASTNYLLNRASELQLDANGNASLVWLEQHVQGTNSQLKTSRYNPVTDTWTTSVLVAPVPETKLSIPSLSSDAAGNQMVLYRTATQGANSAYPSDGVYVQKYDLASSTWLAPTLVKATPAPNENFVTSDGITPMVLRIGAGGHAIAIWQEQIQGLDKYGSAKMNPSTSVWTNLPNISVNGVPALGISATGVATTTVYSNRSSLAGQGQYQARTVGASDATWSAPTVLLQNDGGGNDIKLAINPSGDAATVFQASSNAPGFQFASRSSSSNTWTATSKISESDSSSTLSIDNNGQALMVRTVKQTAPNVSILEYQRLSVR